LAVRASHYNRKYSAAITNQHFHSPQNWTHPNNHANRAVWRKLVTFDQFSLRSMANQPLKLMILDLYFM
jgi:hypothetical protein